MAKLSLLKRWLGLFRKSSTEIIYCEKYFATCNCPAMYRTSYDLGWGGGIMTKCSSVVRVGLEIIFFNV